MRNLTTDYAAIKELVSNIKNLRVIVVDTKGKPGRDCNIFLIIANLKGNKLMSKKWQLVENQKSSAIPVLKNDFEQFHF